MKYCCRECHFLAREYPPDFPRHRDDMKLVGNMPQGRCLSWTKEERETGQMKHQEIASPMCRQGVWDAGIDPKLTSRLEEIIDKNRKKDGCPFFEYSEGMLFQTALELHDKREENRRYKRNIFIAVVGLCIPIIVLIVSIIGFDDVEKFLTQFLGG